MPLLQPALPVSMRAGDKLQEQQLYTQELFQDSSVEMCPRPRGTGRGQQEAQGGQYTEKVGCWAALPSLLALPRALQCPAEPEPSSPSSGFQERLCCHGNIQPIILLCRKSLTANLAGTHSPPQSKCYLVCLALLWPHLGVEPQENSLNLRLSLGQSMWTVQERSASFSKPQTLASQGLQVHGRIGAS